MSPGQFEFSISYDRTTKIISTLVCVLLLGIGFVPHSVIIGGISVAILIVAFAYSPRGYLIAEQTIVVRRLIGNVRVPINSTREVRRATADVLSGSIKLWGSGGLFGYYGLFYASKLGKCWWYVTNRQNAVLVVTEAKTVFFSPDDVDGFLAAIREAATFSTGPGEHRAEGLQPSGTRSSAWMWLGAAVTVVSVAVIAFSFLYSPGPPAYTLSPEALTIHDRFYPVTLKAADVDVAHIRVVDIATDPGWRPTMRTQGFANSHYRSGWFRVANGQNVRLYRADGTRLVLLPPKGNGAAVLIETRDPDGFVNDLHHAWPGQGT